MNMCKIYLHMTQTDSLCSCVNLLYIHVIPFNYAYDMCTIDDECLRLSVMMIKC